MAVYGAVLAPALFLCAMMFVNLTVRWEAWRDASDAANAAARAAAQPTVGDYNSGRVGLGSAARDRARRVLSASGYSGSVDVQGDYVVVSVEAQVDYVFPLVAFGPTVKGNGTAQLSVTGDG